MSAAMGRSCGTVHEQLRGLAADGHVVAREDARARRWVPTELGVARASDRPSVYRAALSPTAPALARRISLALVDACPSERSTLLGAAEILGLEVAGA